MYRTVWHTEQSIRILESPINKYWTNIVNRDCSNKMNNYNNDSEIVHSSIGPLPVRRSTLNLSLVREYDLPSESFEKAIEIMSKNL